LTLSGVAALLVGFVPTALGVAPTNDDRSTATVVPTIPFTDSISTVDATTAVDDPLPDCLFGGQGPTVWYSFTPAVTTFIGANTFGSDYDTTLAAYIEVDGGLFQVACNDDAVGVQSRVRFEAEEGTTYWFMVGSYGNGPGGNMTFELIASEAPVQIDISLDSRGTVVGRTGVATLRGTLTCSGPTWVWIDGNLRQRVGRAYLDGGGGTYVECEAAGTTAWSFEVTPWNGLFTGGRADANVYAYSEDESFDYESATIRLTGSRR